MNFSTDTLESMCELVVDCPHSTPKWTTEGIIVLRNQNIKNGFLDLSEPSYTNEDNYLQRTKRAIPKAGDIVITREAPMGEVCLIPEGLKCCLGQRQVLLRAKRSINSKYLFWALQSPFVQQQIAWNEGTGSTVSNLRIPVLCKLQIPRFDNEDVIAETLYSLANKIELNRQINQTLEAMAQALFKSWFVDFEPVKAKIAAIEDGEDPTRAAMRAISGKTDEELDAFELADFDAYSQLHATASLFPDELEESELGLVPKGWQKLRLTELVDSVSQTYKFLNDKIIFLNTSDIYDGNVLVNSYVDVKGLPGQAKKSILKNDILFSEIRPANKRFAFVDFDASDYVVSTKLMVLRSKGFLDSLTIYYFMKTDQVLKQLQVLAESRSGTFPQITFSELNSFEMFVAQEGINRAFATMLKSIHTKIMSSERENQSLANLRDALLPKLLSGEILVGEVEEVLQ